MLARVAAPSGDVARLERQLWMLVLRIFEKDERFPVTEGFEAERRIANRDAVSSLDQRVRMNVRHHGASLLR
jgi:hypothetical protein